MKALLVWTEMKICWHMHKKVQMKSIGMRVMKIVKISVAMIIYRQICSMASGTFPCIQAAYAIPYTATHWLFTFLHTVFSLSSICAVVSLLPCSLYIAWKLLHLHDSLRCLWDSEYHQCIIRVRSKRCSYSAFQNHPFVISKSMQCCSA